MDVDAAAFAAAAVVDPKCPDSSDQADQTRDGADETVAPLRNSDVVYAPHCCSPSFNVLTLSSPFFDVV